MSRQATGRYRTSLPTILCYERGVLECVREGPVVADTIAVRVGLTCEDDADPRESRRRIVRDVISYLRDQGTRVCANHVDGYWLARSQAEWDGYKTAVKLRAVFKFVERARWVAAATDRISGQGRLELGPAQPQYCA
jgi:hypothetical protein